MSDDITNNTVTDSLLSNMITINSGVSGGVLPPTWNSLSNSYNGYTYATNFRVAQDAEFEGDIKWKGRSLSKMLETIESRLAILHPDPKKLEKYDALKKAYDHYVMLEKLIGED